MTSSQDQWRDIEAERCVLGAMMLDPGVADQTIGVLKPDDFYEPPHIKIFSLMLDLIGEGHPLDQLTVVRALMECDYLKRLDGGAVFIHSLVASVPTVMSVPHYVAIITECSLRRRLYLATQQMSGVVRNAASSAMEAYGQAASIFESVVLGEAHEAVTPAMILPELAERIRSGSIRTQGIPTGFIDLDKLLNGLDEGRLYYIAGRPGMGKSVLLADIARHVAVRGGVPVSFFELEMSLEELNLRMLAAEAGVNLETLQNGVASDTEWLRLQKAIDSLGAAPLQMYDDTALSMPKLEARVRFQRRVSGVRVVLVDYLQLMQANPRIEQRQEQVSELSRSLKLMARREKVAVIVAAQLNRGPEARADKRPQLSDLRESGSLEQDADVVILLHREDYYDQMSPRQGEADFMAAKHRNGPTGTVPVAAQLHMTRFVNLG